MISIFLDIHHLNHFTWWGLVIFALFQLFNIFGLGSHLWGVSATVSFIILFGVMALSAYGCSMLASTLDDLGPSAFFLGNFAVHFYPMLRLLFASQRNKPASTSDFWVQALYGLSILVVYMSVARTEKVYGCSASSLSIFLGSIASIPITVFLSYLAQASYFNLDQ